MAALEAVELHPWRRGNNVFKALKFIGLWKLKILFGVDFMSFKFFGLKRVSFSEFRMFESNLFYQVMVDENYKF